MNIGPISNSQSLNVNSSGASTRLSHQEVVAQFGESLSSEQKKTILSGIETMQEEGASDEEIKQYVDSSFEALNIEIPQGPKGADGGPPPPPPRRDIVSDLDSLLSEELSSSLMESIAEMKEEGASEESIKSFVDATLEENGIQIPPPLGALTNTVA